MNILTAQIRQCFNTFNIVKNFLETMRLYQLPDIDADVSIVNLRAHIASVVSDNWKILDSNTN